MAAIDDAVLLKLAEEELMRESKRASARHSVAGPSGWQPVPKTNKSFLVNTLLQTLHSNRKLAQKLGSSDKTERKLLMKNKNSPLKYNYIYQKPKKKEILKKNVNNDKESKHENVSKIKKTR